MKLKEIKRTAIQSWSPSQHHPVYLATGTSAQQLDSSFSTKASLEFFLLDLSDSSLDMKSCCSWSSPHRYHKLVWGPYGMDGGGHPSGVLIAGGENGNVILYDPAKILEGQSDVVIAESDRHSGPVRALDINPFQMNLVASGGNESEIYIWDMNNFSSPMTPGPKTQPPEDISCVSWNRQVQHILASASPSGRTSVWDLRKNDLIIKVGDHSNRMRCSGLAWNPEVATQLVVASEDDRMPVIQMWDLRFATSPLKILEHHTRGVLSIAWSPADPELLLSCGKDNRILCWNPGTAEVLYELPATGQWCFDVQWCPRNPAVLSAAGFDGHIDIFSILGGCSQTQSQRHAEQISTSFGNMDPFGTGHSLPPLQLPQPSTPPSAVTPLKKPPKWMRRPVGASLAFGGKLVSLENLKPDPQRPSASHVVHISQVVTEAALLRRSGQLQETLSSGAFRDFCQEKIRSSDEPFEKIVWSFLKAHFESDIRSEYLDLLGYNKEEVTAKIAAALEEKPAESQKAEVFPSAAPPAAADPPPSPDLGCLPPTDTPEAASDLMVASAVHLESTPEADPQDQPVTSEEDDHVEQLLPEEEEEMEEETAAATKEEPIPSEGGDAAALFEAPADAAALFEAPAPADAAALFEAPADAAALFEAPADAAALFEAPADAAAALFDVVAPGLEVPTPIEVPPPASTPAGGISLSISQDLDGLITQALLTGDFEEAVELCLHDNRMADSILLALAGGAELLEKTQKKYFTKSHGNITKLISAVVMKDWHNVVKTCDLHNWKEALAAVMTYAQPDEFLSLCDLLAGRLEASPDPGLQSQACLCYICAGNVEKFVSCWSRCQDGRCPLSLQDLVEKVVVLRRAVELNQGSGSVAVGFLLAEKMSRYANLLASQGSLSTAIAYLPDDTEQVAIQHLRERLARALGQRAAGPAQTLPVTAPQGPGYTFSPIQDPTRPHPSTAAPVVSPVPACAPPQPQYYQPVRAASTVTSWSNQTPTALPHVPPSSSEQQVENSNSMYGMAAPGPAGPPPASSTMGYMVSHQYQPYSQVRHPPPGPGGALLYQPLQHSSSAPPPPPGFLSHYTSRPTPPLYPGEPPALGRCPTPPPPSRPPFFYPSSSSFPAPPSSGASFQYGGPGSPLSYQSPTPAPGGVSGPQNGWNDPPAFTRAPKKKVPQNYTPPAPITTPIMATQGVDPQQLMPPTGVQGPHGAQVPYSSLQQQTLSPPPPNATSIPKCSVEGPPGAPTGDLIQSLPAQKVTKKPIPDEHLVLKTTFEALIQRCLAVASDPQTKRKLDDANKRLEALYDKLREQTLSPTIIGGLHNMARSVEARRYADGLNIHTHIVSSSNFSETSAFMPVLKVVLTQANKLGV